MKIRIVLIILTISQLASAAAFTCRDLFGEDVALSLAHPLKLPDESIFSREEEAKIRATLDDVTKPVSERWASFLRFYLRKRVSVFAPEVAEQMYRHLSNFYPRFTGTHSIQADERFMDFPREYKETPFPYIVAVHEWEHVIRGYARSEGRDPLAGELNSTLNPIGVYFEEQAAMRAEWDAARFITPAQSEELRALSAKSDFKRLVEIITDAPFNTRTDYIGVSRTAGRYSLAHSFRRAGENWLRLTKVALVLTPTAAFGCLIWHFI